MSGLSLIAFGGVALAAAAVGMLFLAVFFGDVFLKTDRALRKWMDGILWCMTGGLLAAAVAAACAVARLHH